MEDRNNCEYCFEKKKNCVCTWTRCDECGKRIPESHASEYRGRIWCAEEHDFEEQVAKRDHQRKEVIDELNATVRSQADGEWANGGYKYMKTDKSGRPIAKIKEPLRVQEYERRNEK